MSSARCRGATSRLHLHHILGKQHLCTTGAGLGSTCQQQRRDEGHCPCRYGCFLHPRWVCAVSQALLTATLCLQRSQATNACPLWTPVSCNGLPRQLLPAQSINFTKGSSTARQGIANGQQSASSLTTAITLLHPHLCRLQLRCGGTLTALLVSLWW